MLKPGLPDPSAGLVFEHLPMRDRTLAYRQLLARGPVTQTVEGIYVVAEREAAEAALNNPQDFSSSVVHTAVGCPVPLVPVDVNPPAHTQIRRRLAPHFSRRTVAAMEGSLRASAHALIEPLVGRGECDLVSDLAVPYPARVFLSLFGLPGDDQDKLIAWKDQVLEGIDPRVAAPPPQARVAAGELTEYLQDHLARQRSRPTGLLGELLDDTSFSDADLLGLAFLFVLAGLETVSGAMALMFDTLAADAQLRAQLVEDPSLIPAAVEELVRLDPPVPFLPRITTRDTEVAGHRIPGGSVVMVAIGAASRDLPPGSDPDTVDLARHGRHLAFGYGPHLCLGAHLARLELVTVLREWHRRIPDYRVAPGASPQTPWPASGVRLDCLPLVW